MKIFWNQMLACILLIGTVLPLHGEALEEAKQEDIVGEERWDEVKRITGEVRVLPGGHLTIGPGVTLQFSMYAGLVVYGKLDVIGSLELPVKMLSNGPNSTWAGVRLETNHSVGFRHTYIERAFIGINAVSANLKLDSVSIRNSRQDAVRVRERLVNLHLHACHLVGSGGAGVAVRLEEATTQSAFLSLEDSVIKGGKVGVDVQDQRGYGDFPDVTEPLYIFMHQVLLTQNAEAGARLQLWRHLQVELSLTSSHVSHNGMGLQVHARSLNLTLDCSQVEYNHFEGVRVERLYTWAGRWSPQEHHYITLQNSSFHQRTSHVLVDGTGPALDTQHSFLHITHSVFTTDGVSQQTPNYPGCGTVYISKPDVFRELSLHNNLFSGLPCAVEVTDIQDDLLLNLNHNTFLYSHQAVRLTATGNGRVVFLVSDNTFMEHQTLGEDSGVVTVASSSSSHCLVVERNIFLHNTGLSVLVHTGHAPADTINVAITANIFNNPNSPADVQVSSTGACQQPFGWEKEGAVLPEMCRYVWPAASVHATLDLSRNWWGYAQIENATSRVRNCSNRLQPILSNSTTLGLKYKEWQAAACMSWEDEKAGSNEKPDIQYVDIIQNIPSSKTNSRAAHPLSHSLNRMLIVILLTLPP